MTEDEELAALRAWLAGRQPTRILLTGSRTWTRARILRLVLTLPELPATATLVHGDARGADTLAGQVWGNWLGRPCEPHPLPEGWWRHGRTIPLERDRAMVALGADLGLAFIRAHSGGASFTADRMDEAGIPVFRFRQE